MYAEDLKVKYQGSRFEQTNGKAFHYGNCRKEELDEFSSRYRIGPILGEGTYAMVYKCYDLIDPNVIYAVKVLQKKQARILEMEDFIKREMEIVQKCKHPNIATCREIIETDENYYIVNEFIDGESLDTRFGEMKMEIVRRIAYQALKALEYLHFNLKVFHGDLQLSNIMNSNGTIKLIDFGLSNYIAPKSKPHKQIVGNVHFAAPEMTKQGYLGGEIDIWALGVSLFKLLTGIRPFKCRKDCFKYKFQTPIEEEEITKEGVDFFKRIFTPAATRWNSRQLLNHPWFSNFKK